MMVEVENFDAISSGNVLADFYTETCGPCKAMQPVLEEMSDEFPNVKFAKIDVSKNPMASQMFGVMSVPTMIFMKNSKVKEVSMGVSNKNQIRSMIKKHFNG